MSDQPRGVGIEELLGQHGRWLSRLARHLVHDEGADDVLQETWLATLRSPPDPDRPARPWLTRVLKNFAHRRRRGEGRRARREEAISSPSSAPAADELYERIALERMVAERVMALDEMFRTVVLLRYYEGRSAADIARLLDVPAGTVRWRLKTGLDRLRTALDVEHSGDRRRWRALLIPVAGRFRPSTSTIANTLIAGATLMSTKTKIAGALALLVVSIGGARLAGLWPKGKHSTMRAEVTPQRMVPRLAGRGMQLTTSSAPEPAGTLRLYGQVIDLAEAPVPGAAVAIDSSPPRLAIADVNGAFSFDSVRGRSYRLEAQAGDLYAGPVRTRAGAEPVVLRARATAALLVTVKSARGGAAVTGAHVELRSTLVWKAATDKEGKAQLRGVAPGAHPLRVEAVGFAPAAEMVTVAGGGAQPVEVRLESGVRVSGRVLSTEGAPVAGARVWPRSSSEPFPVLDPALDAVVTDDKGQFRFEAVAAGSYQFAASHADFSPSATAPMAVGAAAIDSIEVRLQAGGRLSGDVRDESGRPVAGAEVRAAALSRALPWSDTRDAFTDDQGRFRIAGLSRRTVQVIALAEQGASPMADVDLAATPEASVRLTLSLSKSIAGMVVDGAGRPVAEAQVSAAPLGISLLGITPWDLRGFPAVVSDGAGTFKFSGVPDGEYNVSAGAPGASERSASNQPATRARPGDEAIRVLVRAEGTLAGRVAFEDGTVPPSFFVSHGLVKGGPYTGGTFTLAAPAGSQELTISGASFVTHKVPRVSVEEGRRNELGTLRIDRGRYITGRVLTAGGDPVPGAQVAAGTQITGSGTKVFINSESRDGREAITGDDGRFSLAGFPERPLIIVAEAEGKGRATAVQIPLAPGPAHVDLVLQPVGSLEGRITRDGSPFPDTVVIATPEGAMLAANFFVTSGPDGRFALDALTGGRYFLTTFLNRNKDLVLRPVSVASGQRARADLDVPTGPITLAVRVETDERRPVPLAQVLVISGVIEPVEGETLFALRERLRPAEPTALYMRQARGQAQVDGLPPGIYTACTVAARLDPSKPESVDKARVDTMRDPLRCVTKPVSASGTITVTVPRSWTMPRG